MPIKISPEAEEEEGEKEEEYNKRMQERDRRNKATYCRRN